MLTLTLDTSCFQAGSKELEEVMKLCESSKIICQISPITIEELVRDHPKKMKQYVEYLSLLEKPELEKDAKFDKVSDRVFRIHTAPITDTRYLSKLQDSDEFVKYALKTQSTSNDTDIFALHVLTSADIFVTKDEKDFIRNGKRESLEKEFNTKVRVLNREFIEELKSLL